MGDFVVVVLSVNHLGNKFLPRNEEILLRSKERLGVINLPAEVLGKFYRGAAWLLLIISRNRSTGGAHHG